MTLYRQHVRRLKSRISWLALLAVPILFFAGCGSAEQSTDSTSASVDPAISAAAAKEGEIQVVDHDFASATLQAYVFADVLRSMGSNASVTTLDNIPASFAAAAETDNMVMPEVWKGNQLDPFAQYVGSGKGVTVVGPSAAKGEEGWFFPTYVMNGDPARGIEPSCPGLPDWHALNKCADVFRTPASGDKGQYLSGDPAWAKYYGDTDRIKNLGLNYEMVFAGSEAALNAEITRAYEQGKPILALMWRPSLVALKYDVTRVDFPEYTPECYATTHACQWPPMELLKLASTDFTSQYPLAGHVFKKMDLDNSDLLEMMKEVDSTGKSNEDVAQEWVSANQERWATWLPISTDSQG